MSETIPATTASSIRNKRVWVLLVLVNLIFLYGFFRDVGNSKYVPLVVSLLIDLWFVWSWHKQGGFLKRAARKAEFIELELHNGHVTLLEPVDVSLKPYGNCENLKILEITEDLKKQPQEVVATDDVANEVYKLIRELVLSKAEVSKNRG